MLDEFNPTVDPFSVEATDASQSPTIDRTDRR